MAQETILVVDADQKSQKLLEVSFKKEGYHVLVTETIKDAIKTIGAERPDLIICDTDLPDGDGFTLCEQLKLNPKFASIPFLFLTEDEELSRKMKAFELGAAEYLQKPIFIKDVTSRVKLQLQELNKSRLHDAGDEELITGSLDDITVIDLLQTIESRDRSGILELEREQDIRAEVSFHKGNILDAECGPLRGEEALYRLMLWPKGTFRLEYKEVHSADHIEKDSSALLIEGMKRFERWNDMVQTLPHLSRVFQAVNDARDLPLPQEVMHLVELFDGTNSLRHVVDQSPVDDLTTLRIIRKLLDDSLIEDVTPQNSLRQSAQHTNLAAWLSERTTVQDEGRRPSGNLRASRAHRGDARLFDTTPGFKSVPGLNADSVVETREEIAQIARTIEEISSPQLSPSSEAAAAREQADTPNKAALTPPADLEEGQPPAPSLEEGSTGEASEVEEAAALQGEDVTHWRFHWDREAGQAVATPRERPEDPFALKDLEQDLQRIEQMRREEEARRLAAEQAFARDNQPPSTLGRSEEEAALDVTAPGEAPKHDEEKQTPREITKDLHRESVLEEIERRKKAAEQDPRAGIEDMIQRAEESRQQGPFSETLADKVAKDFKAGDEDEHYISRQRTDQFVPVFSETAEQPEAPSQDDIETAEIPRQDDVEEGTPEEDAAQPGVSGAASDVPTASDAPSAPLVPLGADISEPTVSEAEAEAYKAGTSPEEEEQDEEGEIETDEAPRQEAQDVAGEEEANEEVELEEIDPPVTAAQASQAEDILHRTPKNQEIVHAEVELKRGSDETPEDEEEGDDEAEKSAALGLADLPEEAPEGADEATDNDEDTPEDPLAREEEGEVEQTPQEEDAPEEEDDLAVASTPEKDAPRPEEEESYLLEAPAFTDEDEGFNKAGLIGVIVVIAALVLIIFFALGDGDKKTPTPPTDPVVATALDLGTTDEEDTGPDLTAIAQAPEDLGAPDAGADMSATALVTLEQAPDAGLATAQHTHTQTASVLLSKKGTDPASVEDPIAALATLEPTPDDTTENTEQPAPTDTSNTTANNDVKKDPPVKEDPPAQTEKTIDERVKEVASLVRRERYKAAVKPARQLVKDAPDHGQAAALLGSAELNGSNDAGAAIKQFERAQSLGYRSSTMYLDMATAYFMTNNHPKAKQVYEKFLKAYPKHKMAKDVESILSNQF